MGITMGVTECDQRLRCKRLGHFRLENLVHLCFALADRLNDASVSAQMTTRTLPNSNQGRNRKKPRTNCHTNGTVSEVAASAEWRAVCTGKAFGAGRSCSARASATALSTLVSE